MLRTHRCALFAWASLALFVTPAPAQSVDLLVNPVTGSVSLHNESFTTAPALTGYTISSTKSLNPAGFSGFTSHGAPGWEVISQTSASILEFNLLQSSTLRAGSTYSLGNAFATGQSQDLGFQYTTDGSSDINIAPVVYTNVMKLRVIELVSNGGLSVQSTAAVILNGASSSVQLKGYSIGSSSGSLVAGSLNGFTGHSVSGWQVSSTTSTSAAESRLSGTTTLTSNQAQVLGALFNVNHTQDLTFSYTPSTGSPINGPVIYSRQLLGDADGDGIVNAADIALISSNWLSTTTTLGDVNYDGIVNSSDIAIIASNWLNSLTTAGVGTSSSAAALVVPEPSSFALLFMGMLWWASFHRRRRLPESP